MTWHASSSKPRASQRGFALLELALAAALSALLAVWAASAWVQRLDDAAAAAVAEWLLALRVAAEPALREIERSERGEAAQPLGPLLAGATRLPVAALKTLGHLEPGFPEHSAWGHAPVLQLLRQGACPGAGCRIDLLVHVPIPGRAAAGQGDPVRIGAVLAAARGQGGAVHPHASHRIRGPAFDLPNPPAAGLPALPAGSVALYVRGGPIQDDPHVRMRDTRDPDLRGALSVAGAVAAQGALSTAGALRSQGELWVSGRMHGLSGLAVTGAAQVEGSVAVIGPVVAAGRLTAGEYLQLGGLATAGGGCDSEGLLARDAGGNVLACHAQAWRSQGGAFGGMYVIDTGGSCHGYHGHAGPNPQTGACSCPPGFQARLVGKFMASQEVGSVEGFSYLCQR